MSAEPLKPITLQHRFRTGQETPLADYPDELCLVLDTVYDTFNVGTLFRLAEAVTARIVASSGTSLPPDKKILKASMGFCDYVPWVHEPDPRAAVLALRERGFQVVALETGGRPYDEVEYRLPTAVVVGNETYGVCREALDAADLHVSIPMYGKNRALNVAVAAGIVLYEIRRNVKPGAAERRPGATRNPAGQARK